jgi:hypothetical protein
MYTYPLHGLHNGFLAIVRCFGPFPDILQRKSYGFGCRLVEQRIEIKLYEKKPERMLKGLLHPEWIGRHVHPVNCLDDLHLNLLL